MELWEEAEGYYDRAIETVNIDEMVGLFDRATSLYLQAAEGAETEESRLRIVNGGDGVAKDVKIRLDAPVEGETTASLETMKQEHETGLVLSVKPLEHGRMKFKIYVEYRGMQGRRDTAIGEAWMQVARLAEPPAAQQVFHITNFTGEIGRDKQVAGGDIVGGSKTGDVGVLRGGVGSAEKAFSKCPYCGEALNLPKTPKFCPYCGAELKQEK